jgi:hypothetical protein
MHCRRAYRAKIKEILKSNVNLNIQKDVFWSTKIEDLGNYRLRVSKRWPFYRYPLISQEFSDCGLHNGKYIYPMLPLKLFFDADTLIAQSDHFPKFHY